MPDRDLRVALRLRAQWEGRQADRGARRLRRGIDSVSDGLRRMESRATSALLAFGGLEALRRPIAAAVREFSSVETALVGVAKTADLSAAELARLDERITGLSLTPEVGQTRVALLEIAQTAGQLGVQGVDDLTRFTATIAKLEGASSDLGGAEAATALARILGVTGEGIGTVDRLGSVIARLGNTFKATEGEIVHASTRVATTLSSLYGVSSREAVALGTALRDLGLRAEVGATGLGQAFKRITDAARQGGEAGRVLERTLGQSLDRVRARIAEGGALGVFTDFLAGLRDAGGDAAEILAALQLDAIESSQVIGTLFRNVDQVREILDAANDEWRTNTALTEEALRAAGTFSRQMQLVSNEIDASAAALGGSLAPVLLAVAQHWQALGGVAGLVAGQLAVHAARRVKAVRRTLAEERRASIERTRQNLEETAARRARATVRAQDAARELAAVRATTVARTQLGSLTDRERRSQARLARVARRSQAAQRDLAVATSVAARAQTAHNIALRRGRTLMRVARGALAAMGGPIGLLTTALAVGVGWWLTWASTAKRAVDDVDRALKDRARAFIEAGQSPLSSVDGQIAAFESRIEAIDAEVFPARAGMNRRMWAWLTMRPRVPRASGDEPLTARRYGPPVPCSPRERG